MNLSPTPVNTTFRYLLNQSGTNITLGDNTAVNWNSANVVTRTGTQTISGSKTFVNNILSAGFGNTAVSNTFGDEATQNSFGAYGVENRFGQNATENYFGDFSSSNYFGDDSNENYFGELASANYFGLSANLNYFGEEASSNNFGVGAISNIFGIGSFTGQVNLILPTFTGLSSQGGKLGELRISGSGLYVCTGATGGWRRTFLQSF
jgi:hypothetical protein